VFAFRYESYNESPVFKVYVTLFHQDAPGEEWKYKNLYQSTLTGVEDEYIRYFLVLNVLVFMILIGCFFCRVL
jgi:hypothetical protein